MTFQPALPFNSVTGFRFLQRTQERQLETFARSPQIQRDVNYFRENIANVETPQDLISDRRLLRVTLTAFGLAEAVDRQAFVRRVLDEGTSEDGAFANRLADRRYARLSDELGFETGTTRLQNTAFQENVVARFQTISFEAAVGDVDVDQRLALNFIRESEEILQRDLPERTLWLQLLGTRATRTVLEAGFNLPSDFVGLDIDRQVDILRDRALQRYGDTSPRVFQSEENRDNFISRFFISQDIQLTNTSSASTALTLLTAPGVGFGNLVRSGF